MISTKPPYRSWTVPIVHRSADDAWDELVDYNRKRVATAQKGLDTATTRLEASEKNRKIAGE